MTPSIAMALPYIPRFSKDELASSLRNLLPDQRCLVNDLRDYISVNGAIPDDDELVCQIALGFRFTRRKFYKYWPYLKTFFTRVGQLFVFGRDEDLRVQAVEYRSKFSEAGKLGAEIKKQKAHRQSEFSTSPPSAPLQQPPPYPSSGSKPYHGGEPPPPTTPEQAAVAEEPPLEECFQLTPILSNDEYRQFCEHCATVTSPDGQRGVSIPSRQLASRLREKFPHMATGELLKFFNKRNSQHSPGLWDSMTPENLELEYLNQETARQNPAPKRITAVEESRSRMLNWARTSQP